MACVRKRRGRWVIDFRDDNDIRRWGSYRTRKEADHALSKALEKVRKRTYRPAAETPLFEETGAQWLANKQDRRPSTVAQWEVHLHGHLIPAFGRRRLDQITPADVEHFRDERRAAGLGAATVNKLLTTGAAVYKYAARHRLTEGNPFAVADRCRLNADEVSLIDMDNQTAEKEVSPDEVLSPEEAASLIAGALAGFEKTLYLVAVLTGARINELLALTWPDVDLDGRKLHIRRTLSWAKLRSEKDKPPRPRFFEPKTKTSRRRLPLPAELTSELRKWKVACPPSKLNLVFPTDEGGPKHYSVVNHDLRRALHRAKLRRVTVHSLRHTFASSLISQGAPPTEVAHLLGHSSPAMTLKVYSHWFKSMKTTSVDNLAKNVCAAIITKQVGSKMVAKW